jgi:hypothetical protein
MKAGCEFPAAQTDGYLLKPVKRPKDSIRRIDLKV